MCLVERETVKGPEKVCQYGVSFDYDKGQCSTGTFHPYSADGSTSKERGEGTCTALGVRPEGH